MHFLKVFVAACANLGELIGGSIFSAIGNPQVPGQLSAPAPHPGEGGQ